MRPNCTPPTPNEDRGREERWKKGTTKDVHSLGLEKEKKENFEI
jgi:hypothetical protein